MAIDDRIKQVAVDIYIHKPPPIVIRNIINDLFQKMIKEDTEYEETKARIRELALDKPWEYYYFPPSVLTVSHTIGEILRANDKLIEEIHKLALTSSDEVCQKIAKMTEPVIIG